MFLETPEEFLGRKAILEIQFLSIGSEVLSPKTSAKFLVELSKQTKIESLLVNTLHIK